MASRYFGCQVGCQKTKKAGGGSPTFLDIWLWQAIVIGLGCRDSNPNYLFQRQASYR